MPGLEVDGSGFIEESSTSIMSDNYLGLLIPEGREATDDAPAVSLTQRRSADWGLVLAW
jgi:hypothetical protein